MSWLAFECPGGDFVGTDLGFMVLGVLVTTGKSSGLPLLALDLKVSLGPPRPLPRPQEAGPRPAR